MKKLLLALALTILPIKAYADQLPVYISVGSGITMTEDSNWSENGIGGGAISIDNAENFSGAVGTSFLKNTRTELEVSYRSADLSRISLNGAGSAPVNGSVDTWTYLVNGYYDFLEGQQIRPYVSAGIGAATLKGNINSVERCPKASSSAKKKAIGTGPEHFRRNFNIFNASLSVNHYHSPVGISSI